MWLTMIVIILFLLSLIRTTQATPITKSKPQFNCSYCDRNFARAVNLLKHQENIHGTSLIVVSCPVCEKTFNSFRLLEKV
jgi:hypothetical protein